METLKDSMDRLSGSVRRLITEYERLQWLSWLLCISAYALAAKVLLS